MGPALLAAALVALGQLMGWRGVDTAAQVYRVDSFRHGGFSLWDLQWYGGHWTLDYSVLYPPVAATLGVLTVTVAAAALAALSFDRLARSQLGAGGPAASYVFAAGTLVSASIGQLTFLVGEAWGLGALWAATRGGWPRRLLAVVLALGCTLTSPLTGAFLALAAVAWGAVLILRRDRRAFLGAALAATASVPILVAAVLFPGDGPMPYPAVDWAWEMVVAAVIGVLAGRRHPSLAAGAALFGAAATAAELVPSALGGNIGRLEDAVALPLAVGLAWSRLPLLLPVAAVPLALSQWSPAWGALTSAAAQPSTHPSFYAPLDRALESRAGGGPAGRVEVVPSAWHWEAVYVAPVMPLARGWERQLDEADNPIFYAPGRLDPVTYRAWLLDNGVRFVALPSSSLDMAGRAEGVLVESGRVPGLVVVWSSPDWRLYQVQGSTGIVSGPARLVAAEGGRVVLDATRPGPVTVRIRWTPDWYVTAGDGCVTRARSWVTVDAGRAGEISLGMSLFEPDRSACRSAAA